MTGSRAEFWRPAVLAAGFAVFATVSAAQTQPAPPSAASSPPQTLPGSQPAGEAPYTPPPSPSGIEVNTLGAPDGPAAGLLDTGNGGLGREIWTGSPRGTIEDLFVRVPLATPVPSVRALARRLVLTTADAPVGQAPHAFQTLRLEALLDAGLFAEAAKLAAQVQIKDDPEYAKVAAAAVLLGGAPADVCSNATIARLTQPDLFWMQLRAYCYAAAGLDDLSELTRGVMRAQGADEKAFEILLDDVLHHKTTPPGEMRDPTAVEVFLLRQAGLPVSAGFAAKFGLAASVLALRDGKNPPAARAAAAEQAVHSGSVTPADLDTVADAQTFTIAQMADPAGSAASLPFFQGQALIRQAAARMTGDDVKARLLAVALQQGQRYALFPVAAQMQVNAIAALKPAPALRAYAAPFARVLLLEHRADAAERWREILDPNGVADRVLAAALAVELELASPSQGRATRAQAALLWLGQNALAPQPLGGAMAQRYAALAVGVGNEFGGGVPLAIANAPVLTSGWRGRALAPAVEKRLADMKGDPGLKGEAILTILDAVGVQGPGDLAPDAVVALVRALKAENVPDAARAFAVDALLLSDPFSPP